jgi:signal transduction histidine kinase
MKHNVILLSEQYRDALQKHLSPDVSTSLSAALVLGRQAVALKLETLELARIHEQALATLKPLQNKNVATQRAEDFFNKANTPIVEMHAVMQQSKVKVNRLEETLDQRTEELAATNRQLQRGVVRRKVMENAAQKNGEYYKKCLEESLELQKRLRQLTHRVLAAQEDERKSISLKLHDEIAQTLLGINVRLLSLKQEAQVNHRGLKSEIASTQRLMVKSVKSVRRVARELGDA